MPARLARRRCWRPCAAVAAPRPRRCARCPLGLAARRLAAARRWRGPSPRARRPGPPGHRGVDLPRGARRRGARAGRRARVVRRAAGRPRRAWSWCTARCARRTSRSRRGHGRRARAAAGQRARPLARRAPGCPARPACTGACGAGATYLDPLRAGASRGPVRLLPLGGPVPSGRRGGSPPGGRRGAVRERPRRPAAPGPRSRSTPARPDVPSPVPRRCPAVVVGCRVRRGRPAPSRPVGPPPAAAMADAACRAAAGAVPQSFWSASLPRSCRTALVCIWQIRLSVTPRTWPISASVRPS